MPCSWYDQAEAYDLAFSFLPVAEIRFLHAIFRRAGVRPPALVLEPMVGTGRLIPGLEELGYRVVGFDRSPAMLRRARRKSATARLFRADAAHFALAHQIEAAHCLIDSFRYLLTVEDARRFLESVAAALRPGAPFVLGVDLAGPDPRGAETWTASSAGRNARVTISSGGPAGPDLEWMDAEVAMHGPSGSETVRSRLPQRVWRPRAFLDLIDALEAFEVRSLHLRDHDPEHELETLPKSGGPVIVVFSRTGA